jgi:uncharacterized membrane protein
MKIKKMEAVMSVLLNVGTFFSALLVLCGGTLFLWHNKHILLRTELLENNYQISVKHIWQNTSILSPLGIIEIGLLALVATQILRVALLVWFYFTTRDYRFTLICAFVLIILLYSFVFRN